MIIHIKINVCNRKQEFKQKKRSGKAALDTSSLCLLFSKGSNDIKKVKKKRSYRAPGPPVIEQRFKGQGFPSVALHSDGRSSCAVMTFDLVDHQEGDQQAQQLRRQEAN